MYETDSKATMSQQPTGADGQRQQPPRLKHRCFIVRHGQSIANVQGLIVSDPAVGCHDFGLSEVGVEQALEAGRALKTLLTQSATPVTALTIHTSDFLRTLQTAHHLASELVPFPVTVTSTPALRERAFGDYNHTSVAHYNDVWAHDAARVCDAQTGVESPEDVRRRAVAFVMQADEDAGEGEVCVFVGHGDTLQILQTAFEGISAWDHRTLPPLGTAEVRELP
ncbi:histidine phosphatase superfamily [Fimicolochytrium jonesii]|uniref:histidine phosphatase superfamily n=1 Tax=Fimicolochytrium jonesii TaxID=1396493 RepID=UPI0022FDDFC4|nr:histidine phosphatase superfamily [Fimicolochytrium jonesii]KAI8815571.1 histidine phosphatase superfamily [Fimicolochytrium jonesii]